MMVMGEGGVGTSKPVFPTKTQKMIRWYSAVSPMESGQTQPVRTCSFDDDDDDDKMEALESPTVFLVWGRGIGQEPECLRYNSLPKKKECS